MTALLRLQTGAVAMCIPAWIFEPSIWKYSESTLISVGSAAASDENGRVGAEKAVAHSAVTIHIEESILNV
jgi:hypothetical protein